MEPKTQYWIVILITTLITIFSIINFAYFLQLHNDDNPDVSSEAPIWVIVINGLVILAGIVVIIYCIVKLNKRQDVEAKIFKHFRDDVNQNKAVLQNRFNNIGEPALVCDKLNSDVGPDGIITNPKDFENIINGFQNLGLNIYEFVNECEAQGLITKDVKVALNNTNLKALGVERPPMVSGSRISTPTSSVSGSSVISGASSTTGST